MKRFNERPMSRRAFVGCAGLLALGLAGCGGSGGAGSGAEGTHTSAESAKPAPVDEAPKTSSDPKVQYIKNYKGQNCANVGYGALNGWRMDRLGAGYVRLVFVEPSGVFVDPEDEEQLKEYVVFDQSLPMNTQVDFVMEKRENGDDYDNLVDWQSHSEVVLAVKKVGERDPQPVDMTQIKAFPDKFTAYVRDYVGRNLAECGYVALNGNIMDMYGPGYLELRTATEDGSYVDPEDTDAIVQYVVVSQDVAPNTEFTMQPTTATNGEVYDMVSSQSLEAVTLSLRRLPSE